MYPHKRIILDKRRPKKDNLYPVKIRITYQRVQKYYSVGIDLSEIDFDRIINNSIKKELRSSKERLLMFQAKVQKAIDSLEDFSFIEFENQLINKKNPESVEKSLFSHFDTMIDKLNSEGRIGSANAYKGARNSLKDYKPNLTFHELNVAFLKDYERKMKSKGKSISTIGIYLRQLRAIINNAIEEGNLDPKYYPFGKNKYQIKAPRNIKKALTIEQIKSIIDYKVREGSTQHFVRDIWLFSYLCNGMNIKDIINLKFKNMQNDSIQYDRSKTSSTVQNPKPIVIALLPKAKDIIDRWGVKSEGKNNYVFPVLKKGLSELQKQKEKDQFVKTINKYMKLIGQDIGYDKPLTTYAARHSFATVLKRSGTPMEFISESLGHKSLQTTEAYLDSFEDQAKRKFMENLIPK